jgi:hypothetical protein
MDNPRSTNPSNRRVGIYERLGRSTQASPGKVYGTGLAILVVLILLIVILSRYW